MKGFLAYQVYSGMTTHFHRGSYDGWKYNFKTNVTKEKFQSKGKAIEYQFAAIERDNPTLPELLKFYYPAFAKYGSIRPIKVRTLHIEHKAFISNMNNVELKIQEHIKNIKNKVDNFSELFDNSDLLPKIYKLHSDGVVTDASIILFLVIPDLNNIVSKEPFVFDGWKDTINFNKSFYSLFINPEIIKRLRFFTLRQFQKT